MSMPFANNKGTDQPAHPCSLISTFVVRCLDSIIPILGKSQSSRLQLASVAEQAGLCLTWSQIPKTGFFVTWLNRWCPMHLGNNYSKYSFEDVNCWFYGHKFHFTATH